MEEQGAAGVSAPHAGRRRADREHLSGRYQHAPGAPSARRLVRRGGRQGHGEPDVAKGEKRLGRLEHPLAGRGADRTAHSRRHRGARAARSESHLHLAARRSRRARGRPEGIARDQEHGRRERRGLAHCPRRPHQARAAAPRVVDGAAGLDKAIAAVWDGVPVQRCTVHKHRNLFAHAPERLHGEITADYNDMIYATTSEEIEVRRKAFIRKWRLKHRAVADSLEEAGDRLFTFARLPPSQWRSVRTTNAIERLHEEFKRRIKTQTVLPSADTAAMLFWALLASGQINMRKVDGWQTLATKPIDQPIDLAA